MKHRLPVFLFILLIPLVVFFLLFRLETRNVSAANATHLVISEIQVAGATSSQDFIELYNPTNTEVSLDGLRLAKRTSGTTSANIVAFASDETVPAHGFYLWCNSSLSASLGCDRNTSATVADNNSIAIVNGTVTAGSVVDAVTFGIPGTTYGEGISLTAPIANTSVERKANSFSDATTMSVGGVDEFMGNGEDTDDNSSDFVTRTTPGPQNSSSPIEPIDTLTPTPSDEPSVTPTPTEEPTSTPTATLTPTETPTETPTPTTEVTSTPTPTPSISPSPSPTPTPIFTNPIVIKLPNGILMCGTRYINFRTPWGIIHFPRFMCFFGHFK